MQPNPNTMIVPFVFMMVVFYFLIIRPQRKKQKEHENMIKELKKNDEIVTSGGIHGTIINVKEKTFVIRVDENSKIEINQDSVGYVKKTR